MLEADPGFLDALKKRSAVATLNIELSIAQSFKHTHPVIPQVGTRYRSRNSIAAVVNSR